MNKYDTKKYLKIKVIVNIIISIIAIYALVSSFKIHYEIFEDDYIAEILLGLIIVFTLIYQISILIHEFGHVLTLKILGLEIILFNAGPIKYIKNGDKSKSIFNKQGLLFGGGYVIPEINKAIYDEASFNKFIKKYICFIYGGIIVTIIIIIIALFFIIFNKAVLINLIILIVNWPILLKSFNNENLNFGDFYIINMLKKQPDNICGVLQNNLMVEYPLNCFLVTKIENFLKDSINKEEYDELILGLADKILDEYIIQEKKLSYELEQLKKWVFNNYSKRNNNNLILITSIIKLSHKFLLHEYSLKMKDEFMDDYNKLNDYILKNNHLTKYEIIKRVMDTLKFLSDDGKLLKADFKYIISDLEFLVSECDNYKKKVLLIINKLNT